MFNPSLIKECHIQWVWQGIDWNGAYIAGGAHYYALLIHWGNIYYSLLEILLTYLLTYFLDRSWEFTVALQIVLFMQLLTVLQPQKTQ